jgi:autophagy-related protein 16
MMEDLYRQLVHRNARETTPFIAIHESNSSLLHQVDSLQEKRTHAEREVHSLRQQLRDNSNPASGNTNAAVSAALQNEKRIRDKLEKLQEEFNQKLKVDNEQKALELQTNRDLAELKDLYAAQEKTILRFEEAKLQSDRLIEHLQNEAENATSNAKLAEQQFDGLKKTIRSLQEENDKLQKEIREYESRFVSEKEKMVHETNSLSQMMEKLKKENEMLRSYQTQETKQSSWSLFGLGKLTSESKDAAKSANEPPKNDTRKWGNFGVVVPTTPKHIVSSHSGKEGTCVRYDTCGNDLVATCGMDSIVKVWDASTGALRATLHGSTSYPILSCDVYDNLVAGASTDKTCRVWNVRTQRMVGGIVKPLAFLLPLLIEKCSYIIL